MASEDPIKKLLDEATGRPWTWEPSENREREAARYQHILAVGSDNPDCGKGVADTYHCEPFQAGDEWIPARDGNLKDATLIRVAVNHFAELVEILESNAPYDGGCAELLSKIREACRDGD